MRACSLLGLRAARLRLVRHACNLVACLGMWVPSCQTTRANSVTCAVSRKRPLGEIARVEGRPHRKAGTCTSREVA